MFTPMYRHARKMGIKREKDFGTIVAIRFTIAKVFYDILDEYFGQIFRNMDSCNVHDYDPKAMSRATKDYSNSRDKK